MAVGAEPSGGVVFMRPQCCEVISEQLVGWSGPVVALDIGVLVSLAAQPHCPVTLRLDGSIRVQQKRSLVLGEIGNDECPL